jgi:tetratricopeptide (TPR) repeat protein
LALPVALLAPADDTLDEAKRLRRQGQPAEAAAVLERVLDARSDDADLVGLLGLCLLDAGELDRAVALAADHGQEPPTQFRLAVFLGRLHVAQGEDDAAIQSFRLATHLNDRAIEAWVGLIGVCRKTGKLAKAVRNAERLEEVQPELGRQLGAQALRAQGDQYRRAGPSTVELAADKYVAALEKTPDDPDLEALTLETLLAAVRVEAARDIVARVHGGAEPEPSVTFLYWSARIQIAAQDAEAARGTLEQALAQDPEHAESALWLAKLELEDGRLESARAWLELCADAGMQTAQTHLVTGEVLAGLGDLPGAEEHLRAAVARDPNISKAHYLLGRVLMRAGKRDEAREVLAHFQEMQKPPSVEIGDG